MKRKLGIILRTVAARYGYEIAPKSVFSQAVGNLYSDRLNYLQFLRRGIQADGTKPFRVFKMPSM